MRLPSRRTFWLRAALLLVSVVGIWYVAGQSRITQANFDRIQEGMTEAEVSAILGELQGSVIGDLGLREITWREGPNWIAIAFTEEDLSVRHRALHLATAWEALPWYVRQGAEKIGVKSD